MSPAADREAALVEVLEEARRRGFLGPGPVGPHLTHARGFAEALATLGDDAPPGIPRTLEGQRVLDLGSGGGAPGLPLAVEYPAARVTLLDVGARRCAWLRSAVEELDLADRVQVAEGRGETLAREPSLRARFDVVVARSFGRPAPTAEIGGAFLRVSGALVVSEPPSPGDAGTPKRWPAEPLERLGMALVEQRTLAHGTYAVLVRSVAVADAQPRRVGIPAKRPTW